MNTNSPLLGALKEWAYSALLFLPSIFFLWYARKEGIPTDNSWVEAFRYAGVLALIHCTVFISLPRPFHRFALGCDVYLVICGVFVWLEFWPALRFFGDHLRGTGVWISVVLVGLITTIFSRNGFIGSLDEDASLVSRYSWVLLMLVCLVTAGTYFIRQQILYAVTLPMIVLWIVNNRFVRLVRSSA